MTPKFIRVASDLHLEAHRNAKIDKLIERFMPIGEYDSESVLVLAGDISCSIEQLASFLGALQDRFLGIIFVPGNHERYGHDFVEWQIAMEEALSPFKKVRASLDGVREVSYGNVRFVYGTLWADGGKSMAEEGRIGYCMNDFYRIKHGLKMFSVPFMKTLNKAQRELFSLHLSAPFDGVTIAVSHHLPSYELVSERFNLNPDADINGGFASDCNALLIGENAPDFWIHGHTHDTIDKKVFDTRVVCNPAGYIRETNGSRFNSYGIKYIQIEV